MELNFNSLHFLVVLWLQRVDIKLLQMDNYLDPVGYTHSDALLITKPSEVTGDKGTLTIT